VRRSRVSDGWGGGRDWRGAVGTGAMCALVAWGSLWAGATATSSTAQGARTARAKARGPSSEGRYYILTRANLATSTEVSVWGASNLPPGAVLSIYIYNFIGEGSRTFGGGPRAAVVGKDGLFVAGIHVRKGLTFRANMVCDTVFGPFSPAQPKSVLEVVGTSGQRLGTAAMNPQIQGPPYPYSETLLVDTTVVTP
jgi:hypothetical protein